MNVAAPSEYASSNRQRRRRSRRWASARTNLSKLASESRPIAGISMPRMRLSLSRSTSTVSSAPRSHISTEPRSIGPFPAFENLGRTGLDWASIARKRRGGPAHVVRERRSGAGPRDPFRQIGGPGWLRLHSSVRGRRPGQVTPNGSRQRRPLGGVVKLAAALGIRRVAAVVADVRSDTQRLVHDLGGGGRGVLAGRTQL